MNHKKTVLAVSTLALVLVGITTTTAAAQLPDNAGSVGQPIVVRDPPVTVRVPVDDALSEGIQAGVSALGGAGIALGGLWLYRRRHLVTN